MVVANTFSKKEPPIKIPRSAPVGGPKFILWSPYFYNFGDVGSPKSWGPHNFMTPEPQMTAS